MAQTPEQNKRYQAALRRVNARLKAEEPDTYRRWLDEALADYDAQPKLVQQVEADPDLMESLQRSMDRPRSEGVKVGRRQPKAHEGQRWNGFAWVPE